LFGSLGGQTSPADGPWSGTVECRIDVEMADFSRHETQTWTLTGTAPKVNGAMRIYMAQWSVTGSGSSTKVHGQQKSVSQWTINVPPRDVQLAVFERLSDHKLIFRSWGAQARAQGALAGTRHAMVNGVSRPPEEFAFAVDALDFGWIVDEPGSTNVSGTHPISFEPMNATLSPVAAARVGTCTWSFQKAAPTPAVVPAPRTGAPEPAPTRPPAAPPSAPGPGTAPPMAAAITGVKPNTAPQATENVTITFTTQSTHFVRGTTQVDLGPGITLRDSALDVTRPTTAVGSFTIARDAAPGPRTITITTGNEVVALRDGFTVTAREARAGQSPGEQGRQGDSPTPRPNEEPARPADRPASPPPQTPPLAPAETPPPAAPGNLVASDVGASNFRLSWSPSADDNGAISYEVLVTDARTGKVTIHADAVSPVDMADVAPAHGTFKVEVRAKDSAGNVSPRSAPLIITLLP
jgi:hypothetical protein